MSHSTYNKMWVDSHLTLSDLLVQEIPLKPPQPERDRLVFFQMLATLYIRYIQIFRKLDTAYDQIVHPQKRRVVRVVLDAVMGRLLEVKNEMVQAEFSEFHYMDDILQDLKLTPADLEIPIPKHFQQERDKAVQERQEMLAAILIKMDTKEPPKSIVLREMPQEEAIRLIQIAERARQGRLRASFMRDIQREEARQKRIQAFSVTEEEREKAAVLIQKIWRGYRQRKNTQQQRQKEMEFIGMSQDPQFDGKTPTIIRFELNEDLRREKREEYELQYQEALVNIKNKMLEVEGPDMKEQMKDQIRQWFIECHDKTGKFPDYPEDEDGGSSIIFAEKTPEELKKEMEEKEAEEELAAQGKKTDKDKEKKEKEKKEKEKKDKAKKKGKGKDEEDPGLLLAPSKFIPDLQTGQKTYKTVWRKRDEKQNFNQEYEAELVKEEKRKEVEAEIRIQVDALMRQELETLKMAVDRDLGKARKGKKGGKKKGKKGGKKKKEKDLTPDRSLDSLYEELVLQGILKPAQNVHLMDFVGDFSYLGTTLRQGNVEPMPSLLDVRWNIALHAILPLGSAFVHEKGPLVKSILLAGPAGTGKRMLVHAVCTETGANLFDLSPDNISSKYPGTSGLQMLMHLVLKVGRLLQPSVIWIGDTEKVFYKKVPKEEKQSDPKRLKKYIPKALKLLKPEDRVLFIGTSNKPFAADVKTFCKAYEKIILVPRPDYASRFVLWKHLIKKNGGTISNKLDPSNLAKISDGYSPAMISQVVKSVLSDQRMAKMDKKPLFTGEFLMPLARADPIFREEEEAFKDWYSKTPMGKKRLKATQGDQETDTKGKGKGKGKDKKGKKK
ncbi:IQ and AAA domain-containing protein 1-like [Ambystoma mexicanum]|uniref:IQ and AAA domain-containing protein 1-like n=1 Tax=Ambystoma mexicanum TaxID=8296 RepID=UPI0037E9A7FE